MDRNLNSRNKSLFKMAAGLHTRLKNIIYCKSCLVSSAVVVKTHLRSSRRPLSPRWDRAGFSWIRAWRLACKPAQHTKSDNRNAGHTSLYVIHINISRFFQYPPSLFQ